MLIERNLADPQSWNRYVYVRNNPLRYVDPDGRAFVLVLVPAICKLGCTVVAGAIAGVGAGTTAAAIQRWFATEKRPGTLGKPDHRATVEEEANRIAGTPEVRIDTPGGKKDSRRADAARRNPETGEFEEIVQVYRPTPAGNVPKREQDAAADIERATGVKPTMVPVRPTPPKKPPEEEIH
jgi:hypothetical protein